MAHMSRNISETLKEINLKKPDLSTLAKKGEHSLVQKFLSENIQLGQEEKNNVQSQLYIASFWGFSDVVKSLVEQGADVNAKNRGTLWTPLHAASFQEHGKIVMFMLQRNADPWSEDSDGRTPADFGSASEKIWPLFAACGCTRTAKKELINKGVLQKPINVGGNVNNTIGGERGMDSIRKVNDNASLINYENRAVHPVTSDQRSVYAASVDGDVLAGDNTSEKFDGDQPNFSAWRT